MFPRIDKILSLCEQQESTLERRILVILNGLVLFFYFILFFFDIRIWSLISQFCDLYIYICTKFPTIIIHEHTFHRISGNISWKCISARYIKMINLFLLRVHIESWYLKVRLIFSLQIIKFPSTEESYNVTCILTIHVESQHNMWRCNRYKGRVGCVNSREGIKTDEPERGTRVRKQACCYPCLKSQGSKEWRKYNNRLPHRILFERRVS